MDLSDIKQNLEIIKNTNPDFDFVLGNLANDSDYDLVEKEYSIEIPEKTKEFFYRFNGLSTKNPDFEILPISKWKIEEIGLIHFATFDNRIKVGFDTSRINSADQWTIINIDTNYELTLTMSSFWSNKIWHWLKKKNEIWRDKYWC
jgi:hypothetical protein